MVDASRNRWAVPQIRKVNKYTLGFSMICHQAIFARKTLFDSIGDFDISYRIIADRDWALRSIEAGAKWAFMDMFVCNYDLNGISADVSRRQAEVDRFVAANYGAGERRICLLLRKYRNLRQRLMTGIFGCRYKGLPQYRSK